MAKRGKRVIVHDSNIEKALRKFKKKINDCGLLQELQDKQFYSKPTVKRRAAKSYAKHRWQKYLQSQQLPPKLF